MVLSARYFSHQQLIILTDSRLLSAPTAPAADWSAGAVPVSVTNSDRLPEGRDEDALLSHNFKGHGGFRWPAKDAQVSRVSDASSESGLR